MENMTVKDLAQALYKLQEPPQEGREGYDALIAITGKTGFGKSDLSLNIADHLARIRGDELNLKRSLIWTRKNLNHELQEGKAGSTYIVDEAIKVLFSKDAERNIDLTKTLNICRSKNYAVIMNIPALSDMERSIRDNRLRFMIWIKKRGEAYLFKPDNKPQLNARQSDPWNSSLLKKYQDRGDYWHHPNCVARITFGTVSDALRTEYDTLKAEYAYEAINDDDPRRDRSGRINSVEHFVAWLKDGNGLRKYHGLNSEASRFLGISHSALISRIQHIDSDSYVVEGQSYVSEGKEEDFYAEE